MKSVKKKVLDKLDSRLPETDALKLHRLLDPSTKDVTPDGLSRRHDGSPDHEWWVRR